jgi:SagB-type dehydrogenase family enzyme
VARLLPGIYRYDPHAHQLAAGISGDRRRALAAAAFRQTWMADAPGIFVIAAAFRRTTMKYGERGERYVHIEAGHAGQNLCLQAAALGLGTTVVGAFSNADVARVLGLSEDVEAILIIPAGKAR